MKYTSAEANKLLKQLNDELEQIRSIEVQSKEFIASVNEDVESVRPVYDYVQTKKDINDLEGKVRKVKHAINIFNTTTIVPDFMMTIDEMLVYLPQLSALKSKLSSMVNKLPKSREFKFGQNNIIDYRYVNYDIELVKKDLEKVTNELGKAQVALDLVNTTVTFDIEL